MKSEKYVSLLYLSRETGVPYAVLRKHLKIECIVPGGEKGQGKKVLYNKQDAIQKIETWKHKS